MLGCSWLVSIMYRIHLDMSNTPVLISLHLWSPLLLSCLFKHWCLCFSVTVHDIQCVVHLLLSQIEVLDCYACQDINKGDIACHGTEVKICDLKCFYFVHFSENQSAATSVQDQAQQVQWIRTAGCLLPVLFCMGMQHSDRGKENGGRVGWGATITALLHSLLCFAFVISVNVCSWILAPPVTEFI